MTHPDARLRAAKHKADMRHYAAAAEARSTHNFQLARYTDTTYQVWVTKEDGEPLWLYRSDLIFGAAENWARSWNEQPPSDVPAGSKFIAVMATTTYEVA